MILGLAIFVEHRLATDGWTDKRTDGRTHDDSIYRAIAQRRAVIRIIVFVRVTISTAVLHTFQAVTGMYYVRYCPPSILLSDRQRVDISFIVCNFVLFVCTATDFSAGIKLAASNFAGRFIGILGRETPILENFAPQKPKIRPIGQRVIYARRAAMARGGGRRGRAHGPRVESACVDIRLSLKTDVLVYS